MTEPRGAEAKRRGVGYPQMALEEAVEAVVRAGQNGRDHSHEAFATYLGHSTSNSGAFRAKLASLRDWGLIERGDRERVLLSPLAQNLVLATPDYRDRRLLLAAFESCRVFGVLYNDSAKNMPMDTNRIRSNALMRYGVAADQADRFVDSFIRSVVFAGLGEFDGSRLTLRPRSDIYADGDALADESRTATADADVVPPTVPSTAPVSVPAVPDSSAPTALRQAWTIDGGEIEFVIRTPKPLPPDIYILVADMANTASKMAELLKPGGDHVPSDATDAGDQA